MNVLFVVEFLKKNIKYYVDKLHHFSYFTLNTVKCVLKSQFVWNIIEN